MKLGCYNLYMINEKEILKRIYDFENPKRIALSRRYPFLKKPIIFLRQKARDVRNFFDFRIKAEVRSDFFDCVVARHQSVLRRKLGSSDPELQEKKIVNLKQAVKRLNGAVIMPGDVFSLWKIIGKPRYKDGYVDGMFLSNGRVMEGVGGGLCQLSNFLYWIFLHAPFETIERYHHSMDVFPDSGRVLPFGGGATILYNFIDLKVKNISDQPMQIKIWLTEKHLKGQIFSTCLTGEKYHVFEKNHFFIKRGINYFRYNEIHREKIVIGQPVTREKVTANFALVAYPVSDDYLRDNNFKVIDFTNLEIPH
jgi:vancomycin resistance protein VanW